MRISILIASRNRQAALQRCLASVARQRDAETADVLVLDDASAPPLDEAAARAAAPGLSLQWLRTPTPLGIPGGRNRLMELAQGEVLVVLDDDACLPDPEALQRVRSAFQAYPRAGILAFKIVHHYGDRTVTATPHGRRRLRRNPHLADRCEPVAYYIGCGHALRGSLVARCGGYPADFFVGHEELDLSFRALDAGAEIQYIPDVVVHHFPEAPVIDPVSPRRPELFYYTRNRLRLAYRYLPLPQALFHMGVWMARYGAEALRTGALAAYGRGVVDGLGGLARADRRPLRPATLEYLRKHYGRVWF